MGCFPCFDSPVEEEVDEKKKKKCAVKGSATDFKKESSAAKASSRVVSVVSGEQDKLKSMSSSDSKTEGSVSKEGKVGSAQIFTFRELDIATKNFRQDCLLGEGGFGRVYEGRLDTGQVVAVKQLDRNGLQGNREFLVEVLMLSLLHHPNLVNLIGYCADGDQRLLVYQFMPLGSLDDHLHDLPIGKEPLDWNTRMKIAAGAAKGLEYLHDKSNPPVIYRDFKSSNILLSEGYHPKLSDFGLAKLGPVGDKTHVSTRVMGTYGYCAPEYAMTGQLTVKSDVYSFGVVFLELITGRKAIDNTRPAGEQNLVAWARPLFKDKKQFPIMVDPLLNGHYPTRGLYQALAVASMCLQEQAATRPLIADVVTALTFLASQNYDSNALSDQSYRFGLSTSRIRNMSDYRIINSPNRNSPDFRHKNSIKGSTEDADIGKGGSLGDLGKKWGLEEPENQGSQVDSPIYAWRARDSPRHAKRNLKLERKKAKLCG